MNFNGKGFPLTLTSFNQVQNDLGVNPATIWAVLNVETRGFGFLRDRRPQILFERHIFHQLTNGAYDTGNEDISQALPGGYSGGSNEYLRLEKAMTLNQDAALKSASWGIAQVMGFNFVVAGYSSVQAMVVDMVAEENKQLSAMVNFIKRNRLDTALSTQNWAEFARGYNGKNYSKKQFDTRLAAAYAKVQTAAPNLALRSAQAALWYLGFNPGPIDGLNGLRTRSALTQFQSSQNLQATGELDAVTQETLMNLAFPD